jgi:hypothetical protein
VRGPIPAGTCGCWGHWVPLRSCSVPASLPPFFFLGAVLLARSFRLLRLRLRLDLDAFNPGGGIGDCKAAAFPSTPSAASVSASASYASGSTISSAVLYSSLSLGSEVSVPLASEVSVPLDISSWNGLVHATSPRRLLATRLSTIIRLSSFSVVDWVALIVRMEVVCWSFDWEVDNEWGGSRPSWVWFWRKKITSFCFCNKNYPPILTLLTNHLPLSSQHGFHLHLPSQRRCQRL